MPPLNCIVDDSALVASVKSNATHSITPWIAQGAVNVFIPLSALERLAQLRRIHCPVSNDAGKALQWLDQVTSWTEHKIAGRVQLQGPDDQYQSWDEVENYLLPDTPLTSTADNQTVDALSKMLDRNMTMAGPPKPGHAKQSPSTSPVSTTSSLSSAAAPTNTTITNGRSAFPADETSTTLSAHGVPPQVRPLLNFTVWCTHHANSDATAASKYILVTNDPIIQKQASKFGVRAKLLSQLPNVLGKHSGNKLSNSDAIRQLRENSSPEAPGEEDEDEVVFDPGQRPGSSRGSKPAENVIDPNHFGRNPKLQPRGGPNAQARGTPQSSRKGSHSHRTRGSGGRGRGSSGGAHDAPPSAAASPVPAPAAKRANGQRGRGGSSARGGAASAQVPQQIDPDSFARPAHMGRRGRGGFHRLWEPASSG